MLKSSHNIGSRGVNARHARIVSVCANILIVSRRPHSAIFCARKYLPSVTQHTRSSGTSGLFPCSNNHQFFDVNCGETAWYSTSKQASIDCPTRPIRMTETWVVPRDCSLTNRRANNKFSINLANILAKN